MQKQIRRILMIPAIIVLVAALLFVFDVVSIDSQLPINTIAMIAAVVGGVLLTSLLSWEGVATVRGWQLPEPEEPPTTDKVIYPKAPTIIEEVEEMMDKAEAFGNKSNERVQIEIDTADAHPSMNGSNGNGAHNIDIDLEVDIAPSKPKADKPKSNGNTFNKKATDTNNAINIEIDFEDDED